MSNRCPRCGSYKKPWFNVCYNCYIQKGRKNTLIVVGLILLMIPLVFLIGYWEQVVFYSILLGKIFLIGFVAYLLYFFLFREK